MVKIKICGLKRYEDILAVNEVLPDYCGFVIEVPKSPRNVSETQVRALTKYLNMKVIPVGVFVNAPQALVISLLNEQVIQMAQLHGAEDEAYVHHIREKTGKPVIKAFGVKSRKDIDKALESEADYILLDQGSGGTGKTFDWSLVPEIKRPFFLAGGLGADNLRQAAKMINPWAVDLSSSLETNGFKDLNKMQAAVDIIRSIQN